METCCCLGCCFRVLTPWTGITKDGNYNYNVAADVLRSIHCVVHGRQHLARHITLQQLPMALLVAFPAVTTAAAAAAAAAPAPTVALDSAAIAAVLPVSRPVQHKLSCKLWPLLRGLMRRHIPPTSISCIICCAAHAGPPPSCQRGQQQLP
jgi:hypothetical protein